MIEHQNCKDLFHPAHCLPRIVEKGTLSVRRVRVGTDPRMTPAPSRSEVASRSEHEGPAVRCLVAVPESEARTDLRCVLSSGAGSSVGASFPKAVSFLKAGSPLSGPPGTEPDFGLLYLEAPPWILLAVL